MQRILLNNKTMDSRLKANNLFSSFRNKDNHTSNKEAEQLCMMVVNEVMVTLKDIDNNMYDEDRVIEGSIIYWEEVKYHISGILLPNGELAEK